MLQNWASGGCVSRKAKWTASAVMSSSVVILLFSNAPALGNCYSHCLHGHCLGLVVAPS